MQKHALASPLMPLLLALVGCGDGGEDASGTGGSGGGPPVECSLEDTFDLGRCPKSYPGYQCNVFVDGDVPSSSDGWAWDQAVKTVQEGIDLARCGAVATSVCKQWQVWVKRGSYFVHRTCPLDTVRLRPDVGVYGGFAGTETSLYDRDLESNETILDGRDGPDGTQHVYHVVVGADGSSLGGFTVQFGRADHESNTLHRSGAGMGNVNASPRVESCVFRANYAAENGAGMLNWNSSPTVVDCEFEDNQASNGAGLASYEGGETTVHDSRFANNSATVGGGGVMAAGGTLTVSDSSFIDNFAGNAGGGIGADSTAVVTLTGCRFSGNHADKKGGGLSVANSTASVATCELEGNTANGWAGGMSAIDSTVHVKSSRFEKNETLLLSTEGGGLSLLGGSAKVADCVFKGNKAKGGGGGLIAWYQAVVQIEDSAFEANSAIDGGGLLVQDASATVSGCSFAKNSAEEGGGMSVLGADVTLDRSVFSANTAVSAGGGLAMTSASIDAVNSAFFGNTAATGGGLAAPSDGTLSLLHCTVAGNTAVTGGAIHGASTLTVAGSVLWNPAAPEELHSCGSKGLDVSYSDVRGHLGGSSNLDADPKLVDLAGGDLRLQAGSPCIDAANPAGAPPNDLLGKPRAGVPDMGAYEYP